MYPAFHFCTEHRYFLFGNDLNNPEHIEKKRGIFTHLCMSISKYNVLKNINGRLAACILTIFYYSLFLEPFTLCHCNRTSPKPLLPFLPVHVQPAIIECHYLMFFLRTLDGKGSKGTKQERKVDIAMAM
jgi:hypothetical protein